MSKMNKKILVAGGGLVGSLLAIMMKKRGYEVDLFEKRSDIRKQTNDTGRSINLIVTSRGLNALQKLGLVDKVVKITVPVTGRMLHSRTGEQAFQPYGRDISECNYSVSRADLNRFLLNACEQNGIRIHFETEIQDADLKTKTATFCGGPESDKIVQRSCDILLGTDGAGSVLRKAMRKTIGAEYRDTVDYLSSDYKELFMPLGTNGQPALQKNALHIWPRGTHMLMALPNLDGSFTMTLYLPRTGGENSFADLHTAEKVQTFLEREFPDAVNLMPNAVVDFLKNPQGTLGTVRSAPWVFDGSVALFGDAAHAIVPFFGQGMNLGFEDCMYLNDFLDRHGEDWKAALFDYDRVHRPNANAIADMALENFVEMRDKVADARFQLKKRVEAKIEREMPELYRSRYGMIAYTLIPYALAQKAGQIQEQILDKLTEGIKSEDQLNMDLAKQLIEEDFTPFVTSRHLNLAKFKLS